MALNLTISEDKLSFGKVNVGDCFVIDKERFKSLYQKTRENTFTDDSNPKMINNAIRINDCLGTCYAVSMCSIKSNEKVTLVFVDNITIKARTVVD